MYPEREVGHMDSSPLSGADFAVRINSDECEPYIPRGGAAYIKRGGRLYDGAVGLFLDGGHMVVRQYCEDWSGCAYLLALNRARSGLDSVYPAGGRPLCCFGLVLGLGDVPLPERA